MGILADSVGTEETPIEIHNSKIEHISTFGVLAQTSALNVSNSIFGNCGNNSVALTVGGDYQFSHCTMATTNYIFGRSGPSIFLNNYYYDKNDNAQIVKLNRASFNNCIVFGTMANELSIDFKYKDEDIPKADANFKFDHCLIRLSEDFNTSDTDHYINIIKDEMPGFINDQEYNYQLDTLSVAKDFGKRSIGEQFPFDILNISRLDDDGPDLGAYERQEDKK